MSIKCLLVLSAALVAIPAFASDALPDSCGVATAKFDVKTEKASTPPASPASGKAQIIFLETLNKPGNVLVHPTIRVGVDGQWAGALKGSSYFSVALPAGEHHVCVTWQSFFGRFRNNNTFAKAITLEPGKTYFFEYKATMLASDGGADAVTAFDLIDADQGKFLLKKYPLATWTSTQPVTQASTH